MGGCPSVGMKGVWSEGSGCSSDTQGPAALPGLPGPPTAQQGPLRARRLHRFHLPRGVSLHSWAQGQGIKQNEKSLGEQKWQQLDKSFLREGEGSSSQVTFEPDRAMVPRLEISSSWVIPIPVS